VCSLIGFVCQACNRQNLQCVPLYDTLGVTAVEFILKHSDSVAAVVEGAKLDVLADALPSVKSQLKLVCFWGEATEEAKKVFESILAKCINNSSYGWDPSLLLHLFRGCVGYTSIDNASDH
jgi:long-chain acyl-CoA synthetase